MLRAAAAAVMLKFLLSTSLNYEVAMWFQTT